MMRVRGCGMKLKTRGILFVAILAVFMITMVMIDVSGTSGPSRKQDGYYGHGLGYIQGQIEDMMGWRKVMSHPVPGLKGVEDVETGLKGQRESGEAFRKQSEINGNGLDTKDDLIERFIQKMESDTEFSRNALIKENFLELVRRLGQKKRNTGERTKWYRWKKPYRNSPNYEKFFYGIRRYSMYDPDDPAVDGLIKDMATQPFQELEMMTKGTELKLLMTYPDGSHAVFKPMRWPRDHETLPNHFYFNDYERHNAEIAAFHLDRLLGFYRVPPVVGRKVNMTKEIFVLAEKELRRTFFVSPIGNLCFYGECTYYCDSRHAFCGEIDMIEGSLMTYLPSKNRVNRERWRSPYRRSYSKFNKAEWEIKNTYCDNLKRGEYKDGELLINLIDSHIFDFMTGNMDRHHMELFTDFGNDSHLIHFDNGRGFGKTKVDEFSILAPLIQCCAVRHSTVIKLLKLYVGPDRLGSLMDRSTQADPIYPILTDPFLTALDRRVMHVLRAVALCVEKAGNVETVLQDDGL